MSKEKRRLTPAEQKRKENFENICVAMENAGYLKKDLTVGVLAANIIAIIIMLPFVIAAFVMFLIIAPDGTVYVPSTMVGNLVFWGSLLLLIILHEVIHGLIWDFYAKGHLKAIDFGVIWKMLTPYCTCSETLTKWQYIVGAAMPTLILGFIPAVIASVLGSFRLMGLSAIMIIAGAEIF